MTKIIRDPATRYCTAAMRHSGGTWNASQAVWTFPTEAEAANALAELYRATRLTIAQREMLKAMLEDGSADAWDLDLPHTQLPAWIASRSRQAASVLIEAGIVARKTRERPISVAPPQIQDDRFDTEAFERSVQARRSRVQAHARRTGVRVHA